MFRTFDQYLNTITGGHYDRTELPQLQQDYLNDCQHYANDVMAADYNRTR